MNNVEISKYILKLKSLGLHPNGAAFLNIDHDGHGMDCMGCMGCTITPHDINAPIDRQSYVEICKIMGDHPYQNTWNEIHNT